MFSRPFYWHDVVEQFEQIGIGSLTVVVLAGFFTGAVLALQTGITLDQFGARPVRRPADQRVDGQGAGAGADRA